MKVICFGNRGSRSLGASDDSLFSTYGGDTTSMGVICDDGTIIALDAGSGAWKWPYTLKNSIGHNGPLKMHMFFSHYHDDHKVGFPQLEPLFVPNNIFHLYGPKKKALYPNTQKQKETFGLKRMFGQKASADNPSLASAYNAEISLHKLSDKGLDNNFVMIGDGVKVSWIRVGHGSQFSYGYRVDHNGQSFSLISDMHHVMDAKGVPVLNKDVLRFIKGTDVFMADSHFTDAEYNANPDFCGLSGTGHSTGEHGVRLASAAGVPIFMPHHYAPTKTDDMLDVEMNDLRAYARQFDKVSVVPAQPSLVVDLSIESKKRVEHMLRQSSPALRQRAIAGKLTI